MMALDRSPDVSAPARLDQPYFFQHWERRAHSYTQTQTDSNDESRFSSESSHPSPKSTGAPPRVRKLRQALAERSISAPTGTIPELGVPTIAILKAQTQSNADEPLAESPTGKNDHEQRLQNNFHQRQGSTSRAGAESKKSSVSSVTRRFRSRFQVSLPDFSISECRSANGAKVLFPPRKERPGYKWTKAKSNDEWIDRLISTSGLMQRRAKSADLAPRPIVPLRPPPSRNISATGYHRPVKLETSFARLRPGTPPGEPLRPRVATRSSIAARTRSIAKHVRFALHRRPTVRRDVSERESPSTPATSSVLSARNRTAEGLHRAASILRLIVADSPSRTASDRFNQSREAIPGPQLKRAHRKGTFHLPAVIRNRAGKSSNVSYTSSIRSMRRGGTPLNTPDPKETYRIKRSASAETEEFFKIDISIRGGTSYLASEARRVHTPPLPGDGPGQKRMAFFFDYTAPCAVDTPTTEHPQNQREHAPAASSSGRPGRAKATGGGTEWYETQLARVDAANESASLSTTMSGPARADRDKDKEVVDLNVPEHLPTSPLCPRHRKHKGGGTGACWMHGRRENGAGRR